MNEEALDLPGRIARARERRKNGDLAGALEDLRTALQTDPASAEAICERGLLKFAAAVHGWRILPFFTSLPDLFESSETRIDVLSTTRGTAIREAMADFSKSLELNPGLADAWLGRARLRTILRDPEALQDYAKAGDLSPGNASLLIERSAIRIKAQKKEDALADATSAVALAPDDPEGWAALGQARLAKLDPTGALKEFERGLERSPGHLPCLVGHARARASNELWAGREEYTRAMAATPTRPADYYYRGLAADVAGNDAQAKADFAQALDATPPWSPHREDLEKRSTSGARTTPIDAVKRAPLTTLLLAACVALTAAAEHSGSTLQVDTLIRFGANERGHVWSGEFWRLVTSMFLHIGWFHLFWNVSAMFGWCGSVERFLGKGRFLAGYFLTGVTSSSLSLIGNNVVSAGASGAAFGMIGLLLSGAYVKLGGTAPFLRHKGVANTLKWTVLWFALGMTVAPFDNWGHLGGLLSGLALGALWSAGDQLRPAARNAGWITLSAASFVLLIAAVYPWPFLYPAMKGWGRFEQAIVALRRGDPVQAERDFTQAYELGYRNEYLFYNRALARQSQKRFAEAVADIDSALVLKPDWSDAFHLRGLCREALGQAQDALRDYNSGIQQNPDHLDLRLARAKLTLSMGDPAAASRDYREALRRAPANWPSRESIEKWLKENGR